MFFVVTMVFVLILIRCGAKILKGWYGCTVPDESSFVDVYVEYSSGSIDHSFAIPDEHRSTGYITRVGKSQKESIVVDSSCPVAEVVSTLGHYIQFVLNDINAPASVSMEQLQHHPVNAFSVLMESSRLQNRLPQKYPVVRPNRLLDLKNDLIDFLQSKSLGWTAAYVQSCGITFVNSLAAVLWDIDGNHRTLADRGHRIPQLFEAFHGYNRPEQSKKKKITSNRLNEASLLVHSSSLFSLSESSYMKSQKWSELRTAILQLGENLRKHAVYLNHQNEAVQASQAKRFCSQTDIDDFQVLNPESSITPTLTARYQSLHLAMEQAAEYEPILVEDFSPADNRHRHNYNKGLVVTSKCVLYTFSGGKNHLHFIWKIPSIASESELLQKNFTIQQDLKKDLPTYHTRAMRREFIHTFGTVTHAKAAFLREAYRRLTGDASAPSTAEQREIDQRVCELLETEDLSLVTDLRQNNAGRPEMFSAFLEECQRYISATVETAVDDRRHDSIDDGGQAITHLAKALSACDLHEQVKERCPSGTPIPSVQWLRLQFWPRRPSAATSHRFTGRLKIKHMVQSRQFRHTHIDCHYASALFRYEKEFAIKFRSFTSFVCQDDKHSIKVGEPGYPVAAVERGKQVLVRRSERENGGR